MVLGIILSFIFICQVFPSFPCALSLQFEILWGQPKTSAWSNFHNLNILGMTNPATFKVESKLLRMGGLHFDLAGTYIGGISCRTWSMYIRARKMNSKFCAAVEHTDLILIFWLGLLTPPWCRFQHSQKLLLVIWDECYLFFSFEYGWWTI